MNRIVVSAALGALLLGTLAGCGLRGALERPPPIWGNPAPPGPEAQRERDAEDTPGVGSDSSAIPTPTP